MCYKILVGFWRLAMKKRVQNISITEFYINYVLK
jgi:hypothetical protein